MLKEFVEKVLELKRPETVKIDNRDYSTIRLEPVVEPIFEKLQVFNLESLVAYIKEDPDILKNKRKIINIVSPTKILLQSSIYGNFKQRDTYMAVDCRELLPDIYFERFMSIEQFIITLKSKFVITEELEKIIRIIGNISDETVTNYNDEGITQQVTVKTGIARVGEAALPPKIELKPYRTFVEIEQPSSEILLRANKRSGEIEFALFEADGGAWKNESICFIAEYLKDRLEGVSNLTILN